MHKPSAGLALMCVLAGSSFAQTSSPLIGRWGFNIPTPEGQRAAWLGISDKGGSLDVWFQPTGGHVIEIKDPKVNGSHLTITVAPPSARHPEATTWDLTAANGKLTGHQMQGAKSTPLVGIPEPKLDRPEPSAWSKPVALFDGKDLNGWQPIGDVANNHWVVKDGVLINEAHGANLRSAATYSDFKVHFEVNCPQPANSGFYLRGRYEVQLEYETEVTEPPERSMGSVYGRLAPSQMLPRTPGKWETFDVTLVGRTVTVARNGVTIIDKKKIDGITGGALDANEGQPGPFYIQGDHTGGLKFRNITVSTPSKS